MARYGWGLPTVTLWLEPESELLLRITSQPEVRAPTARGTNYLSEGDASKIHSPVVTSNLAHTPAFASEYLRAASGHRELAQKLSCVFSVILPVTD